MVREPRLVDVDGIVAGYEIEVVTLGQCSKITAPGFDLRSFMAIGELWRSAQDTSASLKQTTAASLGEQSHPFVAPL